ncbi:unnamed protein product [Ectocarpus sp. 13 AM-2016]
MSRRVHTRQTDTRGKGDTSQPPRATPKQKLSTDLFATQQVGGLLAVEKVQYRQSCSVRIRIGGPLQVYTMRVRVCCFALIHFTVIREVASHGVRRGHETIPRVLLGY